MLQPSEAEMEAWRIFDLKRKGMWMEYEGKTYAMSDWTEHFVFKIWPDKEAYEKLIDSIEQSKKS